MATFPLPLSWLRFDAPNLQNARVLPDGHPPEHGPVVAMRDFKLSRPPRAEKMFSARGVFGVTVPVSQEDYDGYGDLSDCPAA